MSKSGGKEKFSRELVKRIKRRLTKSIALQALPVVCDTPVAEAGLGPVREIRLIPDWTTLVIPEYLSGHALVTGNLVSDDGGPWELCPREMLRKSVKKTGEMGFEVKVGIEIEFFLFILMTILQILNTFRYLSTMIFMHKTPHLKGARGN